jgi:hypothetical protein
MTATTESWKHEPFGEGRPLPFTASYDAGELLRITAGLVPQAMEDKWFIFYAAPHLFFHRSWTGKPVYRVTLATTENGAVATEACWADEFAREDAAALRYESRLLEFLIANLLLGQATPFPRPEGVAEGAPGVYQHHIAGTGYAEAAVAATEEPAQGRAVAAKKPWWRFW